MLLLVRFLCKALKGIPREAYYIATKTGRYDKTGPNQFDFSYERTIKSVDESLGRLGLDYVDVYQLHDVEFAESMDIVIHGALRACEYLKKIGKIRAIGINGYPLKVLKERIMMAMIRFDTVLTYGRYTLVDDSLLEYLPFFEQQGLGIICASAHQCGMLRNDGPPSWCFATSLVKQLVKEAGELCKQYGLELGKIAMYHFLQLKGPATFLVGMEKMEYLNYNLGAYFHGLTGKEVEIYKLIKKT